ncbi:septation protein SepH [Georgenia sp. MJ206]|uniref:septation protein SepH n=1 Tax=Georgenia wangjunii TaxID=3117730 RepID=UPI002F261C14
MVELELRGLLGDGEHLMLTGPDGQRYQLRVNDALRAAVRRDRPQLEQLRAAGASTLRPKDIQAKIRAGATAEEVAEEAGLPVEHVRRYEGPVVAERTWVVQQARNFHIGRAEDAPVLGDLVVDRLAARGVATSELTWDAVRRAGKTWEVVVTFEAGDRHREARWHADMTSRAVHALDDESRWLSETEFSSGGASTGPGTRRHLSPVRVYDVETDGDLGPVLAAVDARVQDRHTPSAHSAAEGADTSPSTDDLLAELSASRGTRQELDLGPGFDDDGDWDLPPAAHPPASRPDEARDAHVLAMPARARRDESARHPAGATSTSAPSAGATGRGDDAAPSGSPEQRPAGSGHEPQGRDGGNRAAGAGDGTGGGRADAAADASRSTSRGATASGGRTPAGGAPGSSTGGAAPSSDDALKRRSRAKGRRTSVPSWDEIVFGAKPE